MLMELNRNKKSIMSLVLNLVLIKRKKGEMDKKETVTINTLMEEFESDKKTIKKLVHKSHGHIGKDNIIKFLSRKSVKRFEKNLRETFVNYFTLIKFNDEEDLKIEYDNFDSYMDLSVTIFDMILSVSIIFAVICLISRT